MLTTRGTAREGRSPTGGVSVTRPAHPWGGTQLPEIDLEPISRMLPPASPSPDGLFLASPCR